MCRERQIWCHRRRLYIEGGYVSLSLGSDRIDKHICIMDGLGNFISVGKSGAL